MQTDALDFDLPPQLLAAEPCEPRDAAKLMVIRRSSSTVQHQHVRDLPELGLLSPGDLMIVNQTRVVKAWFEATRVNTGGKVSGLYLEMIEPGRFMIMLESRGKPQVNEQIALSNDVVMHLVEKLEYGAWAVEFQSPAVITHEPDIYNLLERVGEMPIPPYIQKARKNKQHPEHEPSDQTRYNTVYAQMPGSVAAPTAGLHFTDDLLQRLENLGVRRAALTLNVGLGTFSPIRVDDLSKHEMHRERFHVPHQTLEGIRQTREHGNRIFVVGTTSVRALESLPDEAVLNPPPQGYTADSDLFIHPDAGFKFRFTDLLMTNFHLPRSTLLAMIASLPDMDLPRLKRYYRTAIEYGYRFYSFGDAMILA